MYACSVCGMLSRALVSQVTPSYSMPWSRGEEARSTGSGFGEKRAILYARISHISHSGLPQMYDVSLATM